MRTGISVCLSGAEWFWWVMECPGAGGVAVVHYSAQPAPGGVKARPYARTFLVGWFVPPK